MTPSLDFVPKNPAESDNGRLIHITGTGTGDANTIYTAITGVADNWDIIYIAACNNDSIEHLVTIEWGGTGAANEAKLLLPPYSGFWPIVPSLRLRDSAVVKAYADTTAKVNIYVDADRMIGTID
jgi:hypothetical protein